MKTIIYLSNKQIQIVSGRKASGGIAVDRMISLQSPKHCLINGIVTDAEAFVEFIKNTCRQYNITGGVSLVLNSTKFVGNIMTLPKSSPMRMLANVEKEFTDIDREEDRIYGFTEISTADKKVKVYAENVPLDYIEEYAAYFKEAKVKLEAIYSGQESLIKFTRNTLAKKYKTFVLQANDEGILYTALWADGEFLYANSSIIDELDEGELADKLADEIRKINQFLKAHQLSDRLEAIVTAGFEQGALRDYEDALRNIEIYTPVSVYMPEKNVSVREEKEVNKFIQGVSGLVMDTDAEDYLDIYTYSKKRRPSVASLRNYLTVLGATFAVMLALLLIVVGVKAFKVSKLANLNKNLKANSITLRYDALTAENDELYITMVDYRDVVEDLNTYPMCDSSVWNAIKEAAAGLAKVELEGFDDSTGVLAMNATAGDVAGINRFISNLRNLGIFHEVEYTGYAFSTASNGWDIHVSCILGEKEEN